jgi:hypothetical protein
LVRYVASIESDDIRCRVCQVGESGVPASSNAGLASTSIAMLELRKILAKFIRLNC